MAVVIMAGLALTGAGLVVYVIQAQRLDDQVNSEIDQEIAEFERREVRGDPETRQTYDSAVDLMTASLRSNVPSENELIVAFWDGRIQLRLSGEHPELVSDPTFESAIEALAGTGGVRDIDTSYGEVRVAVKPVRDQQVSGAIVFAYYLDSVDGELNDLMRTYAFVAGSALLVVAIGAYVVSGRLLRPVRDLRDTAREITESDLTRRITATGNDDLTDLTVTFNAMLDRLDDAFSTQRQFLDDVGHELRTPITIVRGHLELTDVDDPREVAATRGLVLDEMDRMARLVEDLILLAKSRRPGFLHLELVDVGSLTEVIYEKMRGLASRDWRLDTGAAGSATLDGQRITQAMLELASNSARHTAEGDIVAVGSRMDAASLVLWVRDTGDGVAEQDRARIFDRFGRGTESGEGSGLGLAIVSAIAEAHHGTVGVESRPGQGATFTVHVPREQAW